MKKFKDFLSENIKVKGKEAWIKSLQRDYPAVEFVAGKYDNIEAFVSKRVSGLSTDVMVGEFMNKKKMGHKYDKPNVKGIK